MSSASMSIENMNIMDMEVTDDRFPGITFTGTAQSVYEQMKALKPNAFPDDVDVDTVETRSLQKRSTVSLPSLTVPSSCQQHHTNPPKIAQLRMGHGRRRIQVLQRRLQLDEAPRSRHVLCRSRKSFLRQGQLLVPMWCVSVQQGMSLSPEVMLIYT